MRINKLNTKTFEVIETYKSVRDAARKNGLDPLQIKVVLSQSERNWNYEVAGGFAWEEERWKNPKYIKARYEARDKYGIEVNGWDLDKPYPYHPFISACIIYLAYTIWYIKNICYYIKRHAGIAIIFLILGITIGILVNLIFK